MGWDLRPVAGAAPTPWARIHGVVPRKAVPTRRAWRRAHSGWRSAMPGTDAVTLTAQDKLEDPDLLHNYSEWAAFYARRDRLARIMASLVNHVVRPGQH